MSAKTVSIVITAHNEGDNVRRTVESILANTDSPEFEIILVDDGSSDGGFAFLAEHPYGSDGRLRCHRLEPAFGYNRARHEGIRLARNDCVVILDAHIAVRPGWLATLVKALERWGPYAVITPDISRLNEDSWSPNPSSRQIVTIDEKLDMVWQPPLYPTGIVPIVLGCCTLMLRRFYYQLGGFDLGLRRWGCDNVDLALKVYAAGGACYCEPSVAVGHLFRRAFPYAMNYRALTYNKLRTGYIHFSDESFRRLLHHLRDEPAFAEAMADFRADASELDHLRRAQREANRRDPDWYVRMFLPSLGKESIAGNGSRPGDEEKNSERSGAGEGVQTA